MIHSTPILRRQSAIARATLSLIALGTVACGGTDSGEGGTGPGPNPVTSILVNPARDTVLVARTVTLTAVPTDAAGQPASATITWSSSAPAIATVSPSGVVTGHGIGTATITAEAQGIQGSAVVVASPIIAVGRFLPSLFSGDTTLLTALLSDADGVPLTGPAPSWSTSNAVVATVVSGVVSGGVAGVATITATLSGATGSQEVAVLIRDVRANRRIAFVRDTMFAGATSSSQALHVADADGGGDDRVSGNFENVNLFQWSPDGSRILEELQPSTGGRSGFFTIDPNGGGEQAVAGAAGVWGRWAPNGTRIAYRGGDAQIYTVGLDGSGRVRLTSDAAQNLDPEWSPDGRQIAWRRQTYFCEELWLMAADGGNKRRVALPVGMCNMAWSPDGKRLAFQSIESVGRGSGVWIVNADGTDPKPITPNCDPTGCPSGAFGAPAWSPDGTALAYLGVTSIYVTASDGGNPVSMAVSEFAPASHVVWSPDGGQLLYSLINSVTGLREVWRVDKALTSPTFVTQGYMPAWQP